MRVRGILASQFHIGPGGLPGNDDAGQMSAWYVLSAMGFYPVCPGTLDYSIGSPLFSRITIHLANGKRYVDGELTSLHGEGRSIDLTANAASTDLWPTLLLLTLLLWPLDIALRRVSVGRRELLDARL